MPITTALPKSGWINTPPLSKNEAESAFGAAISDDAWNKICDAFEQHGKRLDDLKLTQYNNNKNDPKGWMQRRKQVESGLNDLSHKLTKIPSDFLHELEQYSAFLGLDSYNFCKRFNLAREEIAQTTEIIRRILEQVAPIDGDTENLKVKRKISTTAESKKILARNIYNALKPDGATITNGWKSSTEELSHSDLTGFEKLTIKLIFNSDKREPAATSTWLRKAIQGKTEA